MDDVRRVRRAMKVAVALAVVAAVLSLSIGALDVVALLAVGVLVAGFVYWLAPRHPDLFERDGESDSGSSRTLVASLFDLILFCFAAGGLAYAWANLGWMDASTLTAVPDGAPATLLAALVGALLGGAVPLLAEREVAFHQFRGSFEGANAGQVLRFAAVVLVLLVAPGALLGFLGAFVASRLCVLGWWQTAARS